MADVAMHFAPELLNRIDESVVFHALDASHIADIAELQLAAVRARLAERSLALSVNAEVMSRPRHHLRIHRERQRTFGESRSHRCQL